MLLGYARISTETQVLDQQIDALLQYGIDERNIYKERISTRAKIRPELEKALRYLRKGDTFVVTKLDRFGRSLEYLIKMMEYFHRKGIRFVSLSEDIDTSTAVGKMQFQMIGSFAEFERNLISERTKEALEAVKKRGQKLGRPFILNDAQKETIDNELQKGTAIRRISYMIGIKSRTPIYNYIKSKDDLALALEKKKRRKRKIDPALKKALNACSTIK